MFYSDKPIQSSEDDKLDRAGFAHMLAETLLNMEEIKDTFSIGLCGKWGSGKTSIVNMMLHEIEERQINLSDSQKLIVIHFEPWNFSDAGQLLTQFFIRLSNEFRESKDEELSKIGAAIEEYADAFDIAESIPVVGACLLS